VAENLPGVPSDDLPGVLAQGDGSSEFAFVSFAARDMHGRDHEILEWHTYDHRPEQYRIPGLRAGIRLMASPALRAARIAADDDFDAVEYVMTYFFSSHAQIDAFDRLGVALGDGGRMRELLPPIDRRFFDVDTKEANPNVRVGADVLPWWPCESVLLIVESGATAPRGLADAPGVGGVWSLRSASRDVVPAWMLAGDRALPDMRATYCFLSGDPIEVARVLRPILEDRWSSGEATCHLAAPFWTVTSRRDWLDPRD
jgi:hypothetical protein